MSEVVRKKKKVEDGCVPVQVFAADLGKAQAESIPESSFKHYFTDIYELVGKRNQRRNVGFGPLKVDESERIVDTDTVDMMEALIGLSLLTRIDSADKIHLIFKICDTDNDDCLSFREIANMCFLIERVFAKECSLFKFESPILLYSLSDKKSKSKFKWFIKCYKLEKQLETEEALSEDWLISYEEFIKSLKEDADLFKTFLPPTLEMKKILHSTKAEKERGSAEPTVKFKEFRSEMDSIFLKNSLAKKPEAATVSEAKVDLLLTKIDHAVKFSIDKYRRFNVPQKKKANEETKGAPSVMSLNQKKNDDDSIDAFYNEMRNKKREQAYGAQTSELVEDVRKKLDEEKKLTKKLQEFDAKKPSHKSN